MRAGGKSLAAITSSQWPFGAICDLHRFRSGVAGEIAGKLVPTWCTMGRAGAVIGDVELVGARMLLLGERNGLQGYPGQHDGAVFEAIAAGQRSQVDGFLGAVGQGEGGLALIEQTLRECRTEKFFEMVPQAGDIARHQHDVVMLAHGQIENTGEFLPARAVLEGMVHHG